MTEEQIRNRMEELRKSLAQTTANMNALSGAIQDCEYWLEQLAKAEKGD